MQAETGARLLDQLRRELAGEVTPRGTFEIPAERYRSEARLAQERAALASAPRILAASSSLGAGACMPCDVPGSSLLLTRGPDGRARGFFNACMHRGTRLVDEACAAKAIVCPYHGWTYDLAGALVHVPHEDSFGGMPRRSLAEVTITERHGLVWLGEPELGGIDADLAALDLGSHVVYRCARVTRRCNWKLVVEAFLDGYHIRILHRDSVYRYFIDAASIAEPVGRHIRAITGRRTLRDHPGGDLRMLATPSFLIFPATTVIAHPDFVSIITVHPLSPELTDYAHVMLVPKDRVADADHWAKSWSLIEETVFQREDLWVCEQVQRGLEAGATDKLVFGSLEHAARWFHETLDHEIAHEITCRRGSQSAETSSKPREPAQPERRETS